MKEGETVNVGSLLSTISNANVDPSISNNIKSYSPQKNIKSDFKIFDEEKDKIIPKKSTKLSAKDSVLKLENEKVEDEPLILEKIHEEVKTFKKSTEVKKDAKISPAARKMASEANIDLGKVKGSGKNGIILKEDIMDLMGSRPAPSERKIKHGPEERVKMTRLRLTIAKRLKEAQENAAMLTTFNEVDMSEVISMRNDYKDEFQKKL